MITYLFKSIKDTQIKTLNDFRAGCWIYVEKPTPDELNHLGQKLQLNPDLLTDACDPYEVPRLETEGKTIYAFGRGAIYENHNAITSPVVIIIGENFILTICNHSIAPIKSLISNHSDIYTTQKTRLFIKIFSITNQTYISIVNDINKQVRKISIRPEKIKDKDILQLIKYEEALNLFLSDLNPTSQFLRQILSGKHLNLYEQDEDIVEDILLSTEQLINQAKSNLKTLVNIREAYLAITTNKLNKIIRLLTFVTVILTIPMVISGLYGMNVNLPFQDNPNAFWGVLSLTSSICILFIYYFYKND